MNAIKSIRSCTFQYGKTLRFALIGFLLLIVGSVATVSSQERSFVPMMQAATTDSSAWFTMLLPKGVVREIRFSDQTGKELVPSQVEDKTSPDGAFILRKIFLENLSPKVEYQIQILGTGGILVDQRTFNTIEPKDKKLKVVFGSCMDHRRSDKTREIWHRIQEDQPDVLILLGDEVYVYPIKGNVIQDVAEFWQNYQEAWNSVEFFRLPHLIPTYSTWDDHETGQNDSDGSFAPLPIARETFLDFFGTQQNGKSERGPGVSTFVSHGGFDFYLMDDRTWRTPDEENRAPPELETHWGEEQENWLIDKLRKNKNPAWLVNGSQFFGGYLPKESYENDHPVSFKKMLARIKETNARVMLVSGDRHFSELMRIEPEILGYETYEITSSPLQTKPFPLNPWVLYKNPRHIAGENKYNNYVLVDASYDEEAIHLDVKAKSADKLIFANEFTISRK